MVVTVPALLEFIWFTLFCDAVKRLHWPESYPTVPTLRTRISAGISIGASTVTLGTKGSSQRRTW
jgi:hypothetical protein